MTGYLFILTGASGSGKTTLLNGICGPELQGRSRTVKAPKYSERASRGPDDDIICVERIEVGDFDLAYVINGIKYGIKVSEIEEQLYKGYNSFIILSDFRIVRRMKSIFGPRAKAIYIASSVDTSRLEAIQEARYGFNPTDGQRRRLHRQFSRLESAARLDLWKDVFACMGELNNDWRKFIPEAKSTEIRAQKIRLFHNRYIDNLQLFDHVILNYNQGQPAEMTEQMINLVKYYEGGNGEWREQITMPVIFVVAASSGAGKATLMETLNLIGRNQIALITKMAKRDPKPNDKIDGMIAIGRDGTFPDDFDMRWTFHEPRKRDRPEAGDLPNDGYAGVEYAISSSEVALNIQKGLQQIVISNMGQFERFRHIYGHQVKFLYLHRLVNTKEIRTYQFKNCKTKEEALQRIYEISDVHSSYVDKIPEFHHVLLNTSYPEDLYDQMFQLMDFYRDRVAIDRDTLRIDLDHSDDASGQTLG